MINTSHNCKWNVSALMPSDFSYTIKTAGEPAALRRAVLTT
jgi:hypothetical protein